MRPQSTLSLEQAGQRRWDVVVVGAGPAGSMAARATARSGLEVLLIDRETFPRSKVCGCCVNDAALGLLEPSERAAIRSQGVALRNYHLARGGQVAQFPLAGGIAISRNRLDSHLVQNAIRSGAHFLDSTTATIDSGTSLSKLNLRRQQKSGRTACKLTILATGLAGQEKVARNDNGRRSRSYVGAGAILETADAEFACGTVSMACHPSGYVGMVRLEDGRLDLAAALNVRFVKQLGGLYQAARQVITESGLAVPDRMAEARWQGTVRLTHQRAMLFGAGHLVVGDAAGYVEPFTGEGIAWAMASGQAVSRFAFRAQSTSMSIVGPAWGREYRRLLGPRMRRCKGISLLLRQPAVVLLAIRLLQLKPQLAKMIEDSLNQPFPLALSRLAFDERSLDD